MDLTDDDGLSALHWAARMGCVESIRALLKAGADPLEPTDMFLAYEQMVKLVGCDMG